MRSLKSSGVQKRDTNINKTRRGIWLFSLPISSTLSRLKQVSAFAEDNSSIGNITTSVITNEAEKMERKDVCNDSLKSSKKVTTLPTKTSVKLGSKGAATFVSDL